MPSNTNTAQLIEEFAQKVTKYGNLFEAQATELRKNPEKAKEAYDRILKWTGIDNPGQPKVVTAAEKETNMKYMEELCSMNPTSIDDRMKISFAALEIAMYITTWDMRAQPPEVQLQIWRRITELQAAYNQGVTLDQTLPQFSVHRPVTKLLTRPCNMPSNHHVTSTELDSFAQDPSQILGRQFILHSHGDRDGLFYEVVELRLSKEKVRQYQVQLEGCHDDDCIEMDDEGLTRMLEDSVLLEA